MQFSGHARPVFHAHRKGGDPEASPTPHPIAPSSEPGPERPGGAAAESGDPEASPAPHPIAPSSEPGPERPGGAAAESGDLV